MAAGGGSEVCQGMDEADYGRIWCVQWNRIGTVMATCGEDKAITLWKRVEGSPYVKYSSSIRGSHERTIRSVAFSPCGRYLASAGFDAAVVIYQLNNGEYEEVNKLEGHESEVKCCAFSPSGEYLASCSRDKSVWFWQMDEDEDFQVSSILQPHTQDVKFVVWHPSEVLLVSCSYDCSIRFYRFDGEDWVTQQKIENAHDSTVWAADFSADGNSLATVGADSVVKIWRRQDYDRDVTRSNWAKFVELKLNTKWPLYSVSWNKLNEMIAVGGGDRRLRILRLEKSEGSESLVELRILKKLKSDINCVAWNPTETNLLAYATDDGQVEVLNVHI